MTNTSNSASSSPAEPASGAIVRGISVGLLQENCYLFGDGKTGVGVVIDPGDNARAILRLAKDAGIRIERIINTHAHFDHVMAIPAVKAATGAPFALHPLDIPVLRQAPERVRLWLDTEIDPIADPDELLEHGQIIQVGGEELEVRFSPGHAPGHVIFVHHAGKQVFAGDTLFQGSVGRYDLPGADGPTLFASICEQILSLPDDYTVYPGHGAATQVGYEKLYNPYVGADATEEE